VEISNKTTMKKLLALFGFFSVIGMFSAPAPVSAEISGNMSDSIVIEVIPIIWIDETDVVVEVPPPEPEKLPEEQPRN